MSFARRSSHPQSFTTAFTALSIPVAFVNCAILSPSPLELFSDTSYRSVKSMSGDARRLRKGIEGVPVFKIYGKDLRIEPGEVGEAFLDMGQELVAVCRYPVPIPPLDDVPGELAAALGVLPPLVMIPGRLRVVVVDHHPQDPVLHLSPLEEAVDGFVLGLVQLENDLVEEVGAIAPGYPLRRLEQVVIMPGEIAVEGHPRRARRMMSMIIQKRRSGMAYSLRRRRL